MKLLGNESNQVILKEMGKRLQQRRIALSMTQKELSERTSLSVRTITNIENGKNVSFDHWISILKELKNIDSIDRFIPEIKVDPLAQLALGRERKRARKTNPVSTWKWGDEV